MTTKIERTTSAAWRNAVAGAEPDKAWLQALKDLYPPEKLTAQVKHSCPKWAFAILCHEGLVSGMRPGGCSYAEGRRSAAFVIQALELLQQDPSLAENKRELKRRVFGDPGSASYRKPNDEVEVLLALVKLGALEHGPESTLARHRTAAGAAE